MKDKKITTVCGNTLLWHQQYRNAFTSSSYSKGLITANMHKQERLKENWDTIALARIPVNRQRCKHIVPFHEGDCISGRVLLESFPTEKILTDAMTKTATKLKMYKEFAQGMCKKCRGKSIFVTSAGNIINSSPVQPEYSHLKLISTFLSITKLVALRYPSCLWTADVAGHICLPLLNLKGIIVICKYVINT